MSAIPEEATAVVTPPIVTLDSGFGLRLKEVVVQLTEDIVRAYKEDDDEGAENRRRILAGFLKCIVDGRRQLLAEASRNVFLKFMGEIVDEMKKD